MSDLIDRQAAIEAVHKSIFDFFDICDDDEESPMTYQDKRLLELNKAITTQIKAAASAQPEIIRCKDCKYSSPNGVYGCRLEKYNFNDESVRMYGEDFCSYAERRTDE